MEKKIQRLFHRACAEYSLLEDGDRVLVALSGGKDSLMLLRLMGEQQRIFKPRIEVEAVHVVMDNIPYETDHTYIQRFCEEVGVRLTILHSSFAIHSSQFTVHSSTPSRSNLLACLSKFRSAPEHLLERKNSLQGGETPSPWERDGERSQSSIFNFQSNQAKRRQKTPCFLCSWNRRKAIFSFAQERGFNKVALGHHQDDILTTLLMNMIYEGSIQTMPPKLKMKHYPVEIIRPLCLVSEKMIGEEAERLGFEKQKTPCPYDRQTKRKEVNDLFHQLEAMNPEARYSLWNSMRNIHPDLLV